MALYLLLAMLTSFVGSLQLGPVNAAVLRSCLKNRYTHALWIAIGGSVPEMFFCAAAIWAADWMSTVPAVVLGMKVLLVVALVALGLRFILTKPPQGPPPPPPSSLTQAGTGFTEGLLLGGLNPQLILYWVAVITYLMEWGLGFSTLPQQLAFCVGTTLGAFALHYLLISVTRRLGHRMEDRLRLRLMRITGIFLLGLGLYNGIQLLLDI